MRRITRIPTLNFYNEHAIREFFGAPDRQRRNESRPRGFNLGCITILHVSWMLNGTKQANVPSKVPVVTVIVLPLCLTVSASEGSAGEPGAR